MFGRLVAGLFGGLLVAQLGATALVAAISLMGKTELVASFIHPAATTIFLWSLLAVFMWFIGPVVAFGADSSWQAWRHLSLISALLAFSLAALAFLASGTDTTFTDIKTAYATVAGQFDRAHPASLLRSLPDMSTKLLLRVVGPICLVVGVFLLLAGLFSGRDEQNRY